MAAEIRWVIDGVIGLQPIATDAIDYAEKRLSDKDEMKCSISDMRMKKIRKVHTLLNKVNLLK